MTTFQGLEPIPVACRVSKGESEQPGMATAEGETDEERIHAPMPRRSFLTALTGAAALGSAGWLRPAHVRAQAPVPGATPDRGPGPAGLTVPDPYAGKKKVLAIGDVHTGYQHDSVSHALATIERLGRESGAYITYIRTDTQLVTKDTIYGTGRYSAPPDGHAPGQREEFELLRRHLFLWPWRGIAF